MNILRILSLFLLGLAPALADDILFIGNSFTFAAEAPVVHRHGGVPALFREIARSQGKDVSVTTLASPGKDWGYHLAQPVTARTLSSRKWSWVVLQDLSTGPTHIGDIPAFLRDGAIFSDRIAANSPATGILLYETWARPPGHFYQVPLGNYYSGPVQMMRDLHESYHRLRDELAARDSSRPVRVALVGTAFARIAAEYPSIQLNARDHHHATAEGYYLAALVIDETIYGHSVRGAATSFLHHALVIPTADAAILQQVADAITSPTR